MEKINDTLKETSLWEMLMLSSVPRCSITTILFIVPTITIFFIILYLVKFYLKRFFSKRSLEKNSPKMKNLTTAGTLQRYNERPFYMHLYMLFPYITIILAVTGYMNKPLLVLLSFAFGLAYLSTFWNIKILIFQCFGYQEDGNYIFFDGKLCKLIEEENKTLSFFFNRRKFLLENNEITELLPVTKATFSELRNGIIVPNYALYPKNEFEIQLPNFFTMFKEQCVTPLFTFQIFSSLLLCLDEHVMNSLLSIAIILFAEAIFVFSRVITMKMFRKLDQKENTIKRLRLGDGSRQQNEMVKTTCLKPGDKVVIDSLIDVPCDMLILDGSCSVNEAMLSGESVPVLKEEAVGESEEVVCFDKHKKHILFAGTKLEKIHKSLTCVVLRTSFDTEQGVLLDKMLQSEDIKYDPEALRFILLLSFISLVNSIFTIKYSTKTGYSLLLDVIILFTSSIPFELPMILNMSIQSAVKNLMLKKIYCLEPFRITLAGKVDVCCFDKTGTLTDTRLEVKGIEQGNENTSKVLSCCHNLISVDGQIKGDPMEIAIFNHSFDKSAFKILQQFSFSSELKRQCVLAEIDGNKGEMLFCMKGAPETVKNYLSEVPENYKDYEEYAKKGFRVIALACREIPKNELAISNRVSLEKDLKFCGFVLLESSLRKDAKEMCQTLQASGLKVVMITGDNLLTAGSVAKQLGIEGKCVEGKDIESILNSANFKDYTIFGRAEPKHKELIIKKYKKLGLHTMMVGDGTNDVGALKAADVGVAMLEAVEVVVPADKENNNGSLLEQAKAEFMAVESIKPGDASIAAPITVKSNTLQSIVEIIQQGRSSLVSTIQMYKILAIKAIFTSFFYMLIDILGIKFSDAQMVSIGILSSIGFTAIAQPKSLNSISKERPITSIFDPYILSSIILQSVIQVSSLYLIYKYIPCPEIASSFTPSLMNTALYIIWNAQNIVNVSCNYIGRPFREGLLENRLLCINFLAVTCFLVNVLFPIIPQINNFIQVVVISPHSIFLCGLCISMFLLRFAADRICQRIFKIKNN
ncbi:putative cation-transporting ATPase 1 [Glugoides intestinalis]